jgi:hypothetical protein
MILSFKHLTSVLFVRLDHSKESILPPFREGTHINNIIIKVYLCPFPILLLALKLSIIKLLFLMQNQKPLIFRLALFIRVAKICTIFIFFDKRKGNFDSTKFIERIHNPVYLFRRCACIDSFDLVFKVVFYNEILHV